MARVRVEMMCVVRWCRGCGVIERSSGSMVMARDRRRSEAGCVLRRLW